MDSHQLRNCIRSLSNIEGFQLPELSADQQRRFLRDPIGYFLAADEEQACAIMREVEKRQSERAPRKKRLRPRVREQGELLLPIAGKRAVSTSGVGDVSTPTRKRAG